MTSFLKLIALAAIAIAAFFVVAIAFSYLLIGVGVFLGIFVLTQLCGMKLSVREKDRKIGYIKFFKYHKL